MTDKYAELRDALAAGPTPGPWEADGSDIQQKGRLDVGICEVMGIYEGGSRGWNRGQETGANIVFIAAANPETIRALLAERDALREALKKVRPVIAADRQGLLETHGNGTEIPATDELGSLALHEYDCALATIDAALTQEQGDSHA